MKGPKPWTKGDRKRVWGAVDSWRSCNRPDPSRGRLAELPTDPALLVAIAKSWLGGLKGLGAERAQKNREFVQHLHDHPNVYGKSTPEMVERFTKLAEADEKGVSQLDKLIARLDAEGMPPKPDDWKD